MNDIIGDIPRNTTEITRVSISEFKGKKYLDIRIWFKDDNGEYAPGKKGVSVNVDAIAELKNLIARAEESLAKGKTE